MSIGKYLNPVITRIIIILLGLVADFRLGLKKFIRVSKEKTFTFWHYFIFCPHAGGINIIDAKLTTDSTINITAQLVYYLHVLNDNSHNHRSLGGDSSFSIVKFLEFVTGNGATAITSLEIVWYDYKSSKLYNMIVRPGVAKENQSVSYKYNTGGENTRVVAFKRISFKPKYSTTANASQ